MKNQNRKKKIGIITLSALVTIGGIAATMAYFSTSTEFVNSFKLGNPEAEFMEEFEAPNPDDMIYGGEYTKTGKVINSGEQPVVARAKIEAVWGDGTTKNVLDPVPTDPPVEDPSYPRDPRDVNGATLNFGGTAKFPNDVNDFPFAATATSNDGKWVYVPAVKTPDFGYFYYNKIIKPKENGVAGVSSELLDSVYVSAALGETKKTEALYFLKGDYADYKEAKTALDNLATNVFKKQDDFVKENAPGAIMVVAQASELIYPDFKGKELKVTISSLIIQADDESVQAAFGIESNSENPALKAIYDGWKTDGLVTKNELPQTES